MTAIDGVLTFRHDGSADSRGSFTKVFRNDRGSLNGLTFAECYYSVSRKGVLRGLHFQEPPFDHLKLVTCIEGEAFDCVVDLRRQSPSYGRAMSVTLAAGDAILIPSGCAHGFCAVSEETLLLYHVTTVHAPAHDAGIHWTSADVPWPYREPIVSDRDRSLPHLRDYNSPFT